MPMAEQAHREFIEAIDNQTMKDTALRGDPPFGWLARAFRDLYGADTTYRKNTAMAPLIYVKPEFQQFIAYVTRIDPSFPSWECPDTAVSAPYVETTELMRPCFKARVERLHKYWLQYRIENNRSPSNSAR